MQDENWWRNSNLKIKKKYFTWQAEGPIDTYPKQITSCHKNSTSVLDKHIVIAILRPRTNFCVYRLD